MKYTLCAFAAFTSLAANIATANPTTIIEVYASRGENSHVGDFSDDRNGAGLEISHFMQLQSGRELQFDLRYLDDNADLPIDAEYSAHQTLIALHYELQLGSIDAALFGGYLRTKAYYDQSKPDEFALFGVETRHQPYENFQIDAQLGALRFLDGYYEHDESKTLPFGSMRGTYFVSDSLQLSLGLSLMRGSDFGDSTTDDLYLRIITLEAKKSLNQNLSLFARFTEYYGGYSSDPDEGGYILALGAEYTFGAQRSRENSKRQILDFTPFTFPRYEDW